MRLIRTPQEGTSTRVGLITTKIKALIKFLKNFFINVVVNLIS